MKSLLAILFVCCSHLFFAQDSISPKLNGAWILSAIRHDNTLYKRSDYLETGAYRLTFPNTHWLFKDQKIYEIDYPCCLLEVSDFVIENKTAIRIKEKGQTHSQSQAFFIDFRNDSLIFTSDYEYGSTYYFLKDTIPVKELTKFSDGYINPVCLYGDWSIPIGEVSDGADAINVWYPWKMKEKIHVDANNLHHYWANNRFYLEIDGVKRPFKVENVSLRNDNMSLIPENWVNEYIKKQKLDPYQISNVWLRRIDY
jgi:hypothetical protein